VKNLECPHCRTLNQMTYEKYYTPSGAWFGLRCIPCGEIIDPLILANRHAFEPDPKGFNRGPHKRRSAVEWRER
jgi:hypothetical protein